MPDYTIPEGSLISFFSNKVKQYGGINFAQGIPGYAPPEELLESLRLIIDSDIHQYAPGKGNHRLLDLIVEKYAQPAISREEVLIVQGATEAIALVYIYLSQQTRDFTVLSFDPVYESYNNLPLIFGNSFVSFPLENFSLIDFDRLESTIIKEKVKLVMVSSPGNPLGKIYSRKETERLLEMAVKHDFYLLFDAVYKDLYFNEPPWLPVTNMNDRLFYVNSFSKMLSITGWRIGYLICSSRHMKKIASIHDYIGLCAPSLLQEAIAKYLEQNSYAEMYLAGLRKKLGKSFHMLKDALEKHRFNTPPVEGGYFIWAGLPEKFPDGFRFAIDLYEQEKVAVIPGIHFSANGKKYIRLNIAREEEEIMEGIERINRFFRSGSL